METMKFYDSEKLSVSTNSAFLSLEDLSVEL